MSAGTQWRCECCRHNTKQRTQRMMNDRKRRAIVGMFKGLRVTDICDAMDAVGLQDTGVMAGDIRPLWRDVEHFRHRIFGFAHTVRFLPTKRRAARMTIAEFDRWKGQWYEKLANAPIRKDIR